MRTHWMLAAAAVTMIGGVSAYQGQKHLNPVIDLLAQKKPVFGLYAPSAGGGGRRGAPPPADAPPRKTPAQLAEGVVADRMSDYLFDGSMEGDFDRGYANFSQFMAGMAAAGPVEKSPAPRLPHPVFVKTHEIAPDPALAAQRIAKQLNMGVSGVVFVGVESADEVKAGLAAMRFKSHGGTRPDDVGNAPAFWGMSEQEYKTKADVWPLNPRGELMNWTIVESKEGLKHIREIAAVKGIGVLFPGAGTMRRVFSETVDGTRKVDTVAWEGAIQQVLAACKEFNVPCGYPATENDIEMRMKQGFSVFVINPWGEAGFRTIEVGRKASGR